MQIRSVIAFAMIFISAFGGYSLQPAQAAFCTVEDIKDGIDQGVPLDEILRVCDELDVRCPADQVYFMILEGVTLPDIYYQCR